MKGDNGTRSHTAEPYSCLQVWVFIEGLLKSKKIFREGLKKGKVKPFEDPLTAILDFVGLAALQVVNNKDKNKYNWFWNI